MPCSRALTRVLRWDHAFTDTTFESNYCGCERARCPNEYIRNSNQVSRICHVRLCLCVAFARMSDIIYSPAACRLGGSGPVVCLLYPFTWILKARSAEEKPATCLRAAPPQRVLLVRAPAALAAPSPNHPVPGASACGVVCECAWKGNRPRQTATLLGSPKANVTAGAGRWVKKAALAAKAHLEHIRFVGDSQ